MLAQPYEIHLERLDPAQNMARYYALAIQPTLFGEIQLTRRWGRIGSRGQSLSHVFRQEDDAVRLFLELLRRKRNRGYAPRSAAAAPYMMKVRERSHGPPIQHSGEVRAAAIASCVPGNLR